MATLATGTNNGIDSCLVLYATQSGRAKACARRSSRILAELSSANDGNSPSPATFKVSASGYRSIDDKYRGMSNIKEFAAQYGDSKTLLVLFVSTTGDGEQTDSMQRIWKQLYVNFFLIFFLVGGNRHKPNVSHLAYFKRSAP